MDTWEPIITTAYALRVGAAATFVGTHGRRHEERHDG